MFIHIGGDTMVRAKDVVGIFDVEVQSSVVTREFIDGAKRHHRVDVVEVGEIKSIVVTPERLYFSPISSLTLKRRAYVFEPLARPE